MGNVWSVCRHSKLTKWTSDNGWICRCILYVARPPAPFHLPRQHTLARSGAESLGRFGIAPAAPEMSGLERVGRSLTSPSLSISLSPTGSRIGWQARTPQSRQHRLSTCVQRCRTPRVGVRGGSGRSSGCRPGWLLRAVVELVFEMGSNGGVGGTLGTGGSYCRSGS